MTDKKLVYSFGGGTADGSAEMKELLGGKGANLAQMNKLGVPVPPGFTITTAVCNQYFADGCKYPAGLEEQVKHGIDKMNTISKRVFGHAKNPLLVSVRSGAPASMPGMMDTILNLGLNDEIAKQMAIKFDNETFVYDAYRRLVMMYGDVVLGVHRSHFEELMDKAKEKNRVTNDHEVPACDLKEIVKASKEMLKKEGKVFPDDPMEQLWGAVAAVFKSWTNPRAITYRQLNNIPKHWGTAVNVQAMVFGNMNDNSGTGVAFTRDPATGTNVFFGEWLQRAQGEDVVAGIRTPQPISEKDGGDNSLEHNNPKIYKELCGIRNCLENHYKDMQDIEFTIEEGRLWLLQTRVGKRTGLAAVKIAMDMLDEKLIDEKDLVLRLEPEQLNHLLKPVFNPEERKKAIVLGKGLAAGPGAASGNIALSAEKATVMAKSGPVILVRHETSPEDIAGMDASLGILTAKGGMTSHAALVARQMGKVCVAGCDDADIDYKEGTVKFSGKTFREGDRISIDGSTGEVLEGLVGTKASEVIQGLTDKDADESKLPVYKMYKKIMEIADKYRQLNVRTNADQGDQAAMAISFGAEGIGLCRTEHMFFGEGKIGPMRQMILADNEKQRRAALDNLLPLQREDFVELFKVMNGHPVTVRLLDPPLHEFLPHEEKEMRELATKMDVSFEHMQRKVASLHEFNPMLGHRGCRLGISYPEITEMQTRAILEAAIKVKRGNVEVFPEIMVPLIGNSEELRLQKEVVIKTADEVFKDMGESIPYHVGTMIEIPRAALTADQVAEQAEFFSFGTNDLTQTALGMSRDDSGVFLQKYAELEVYPRDPFEALDQEGVGQLVSIAAERGRKTKPDLKLGICGEHGGEPTSIEFCHRTGLNYVSCSPYRVPIARLAAARAAIRNPR